MNSFGLGLILNFTDNASASMGSALNSFMRMSEAADQLTSTFSGTTVELYAVAQGMIQVGDTMTRVGSSITSTLFGIGQTVINTGGEFFGYRMQLNALYGSAEEGEAMLERLKQKAETSVFDVQGLLSSVTMMKVVGIDALKEITTTSGETTQSVLDYASDIAAMIPNIRNTYGTGVSGAMGALKEYIAEGNALTLKRSAGLDITGLLGEDKGKTIEERTRQVADLVEQLGVAGYTTSLFGTPMQILSNMSDYWVNFLDAISTSGVYDKYASVLSTIGTFIENLVSDTDRYNTIVESFSGIIIDILDLAERLISKILEVSERVVDWVADNPKIAKNILLVVGAVGAFLLVFGNVLKMSGSLLMFTMSIRQITSGLGIFKSLSVVFRNTLTTIIPLVSVAVLLYLTWKNNLFGIRDIVTQVFSDVGTVFSVISEAWNDNTLSVESFQKATDLGILPFIESILDLKYLWGEFTKGFSTGFQKVFSIIDEFFPKITLLKTSVFDSFGSIGTFLKGIFNVQTDSEAWERVGEIFGNIVGALVIAIPLIMTAIKAFTLISGIVSFVTTPLGLIVLAIAAVVAAVVGLKYAWDNNLGGIVDKVETVSESIKTFYSTYIAPFVDRVVTAVERIVAIVKNMWESWLKPIFTQISTFLANAWSRSLQPLLSRIGSFAKSAVNFVWTIIQVCLDFWNDTLAPIINWLVTVLAPAVNGVVQIILGVINFVWTTISDIVSAILKIFGGVLDFLSGLFAHDWELTWQGICEVFGGIWDLLVGIVKGVVNSVITVINTLISSFYSVLAGVVNGVGSIFGSITSALGFEDKGFSIPEVAPQIPLLAEGGVVVKETAAVIGEGKDHEAILPLNNRVFGEIAKGINNNKPVSSNSQSSVHNDYSVTFSAGSVVIQLSNASDAELEKAAYKLMKIIERKQKLRALAVRQ